MINKINGLTGACRVLALVMAFVIGFTPTAYAADAFQFRNPADNVSLGEIDTSGNVVFRSSHTASTYFGDGSQLTGIVAATADALTNDPNDCSANEFANAINASADLSCAALVDADIPNSITVDLAATATALAADPSNCSAGSGAGGIAANGTAEDCTDYVDVAGDTMTGQLQTDNGTEALPGLGIADTDTGFSQPASNEIGVSVNAVTIATFTSAGLSADGYTEDGSNTLTNSITGLAGTATALAANGANCSANEFNKGVDASGAAESCATLLDADIPNNITIDLAATATALAANGGNCSAGSAPLGVDASGAVEGCTDYVDVAGDTMTGVLVLSDGSQALPGLAMSGDTNTGIDSLLADTVAIIANGTVSSTHSATGIDAVGYTEAGNNTLTNSIDGNAGTATALAADPTDCSANQFAQSIVASGNLTCAAIADADVPNTITIDNAATADALSANGGNCTSGSAPEGVDAAGAVEGCTDYIGTGGGESIAGILNIGSTSVEMNGAATNATICADACANGTGRCQYNSTTDGDMYISTGTATGMYRNGRTGTGPC